MPTTADRLEIVVYATGPCAGTTVGDLDRRYGIAWRDRLSDDLAIYEGTRADMLDDADRASKRGESRLARTIREAVHAHWPSLAPQEEDDE